MLKINAADSKPRTRARPLPTSTQLAGRIFTVGRDLLAGEIDGTKFRMIGIGVSAVASADHPDAGDLIDHRNAEAEHAMDRLRKRFGRAAVVKGLGFEAE